jgi:hypothetical protein
MRAASFEPNQHGTLPVEFILWIKKDKGRVSQLMVVYYVYGRFVYNMSCLIFTFMWRSIETNFFIIKTNQMHQFPKFTPAWNSTCFGQFLCPSSGVYSLYTQHWYMSYRFVDSFRTGPVVLLESCMTYTSGEFTVNKLLVVGRGTARNM